MIDALRGAGLRGAHADLDDGGGLAPARARARARREARLVGPEGQAQPVPQPVHRGPGLRRPPGHPPPPARPRRPRDPRGPRRRGDGQLARRHAAPSCARCSTPAARSTSGRSTTRSASSTSAASASPAASRTTRACSRRRLSRPRQAADRSPPPRRARSPMPVWEVEWSRRLGPVLLASRRSRSASAEALGSATTDRWPPVVSSRTRRTTRPRRSRHWNSTCPRRR